MRRSWLVAPGSAVAVLLAAGAATGVPTLDRPARVHVGPVAASPGAPASGRCGGQPGRRADLVAVTGSGRKSWDVALPAHCDGSDDSDTAPVVAGPTVYAAQGGLIVAVDLRTGRRLWTRPMTGRVAYLTRTAHGLLVGTLPDSGSSLVVLLAPATGRVRWSAAPTGGPVGGVLPTGDGGVVLTRPNGQLLVLDLATGRVRWRTTLHPFPSVAISQKVLAVTDDRTGVLRAYDVRSGRLLWKRKPGTGSPDPEFAPGIVITQPGGLGPGDNGLTAYELRTGRKLWVLPGSTDSNDDYHILAVGRGVVVAVHGQPTTLSVIDAPTGTVRWQRPVRTDLETPVVITGGDLAVVVDSGGRVPQDSLAAFDLLDGAPAWQVRLPPGLLAAPARYGGPPTTRPVLSLATSERAGRLFAIDLGRHRVLWSVPVRTGPLVDPTPAGDGAVAQLLDPEYGAPASG